MIKIKINSKLEHLKAKSPQLKAKAVTYVADELLKRSEIYIPVDTGMMRDSGNSHSMTKYGKLVWQTPYVRYQWLYGKANGLQGRKWALRAWADYKKIILANANQILSGKVQI